MIDGAPVDLFGRGEPEGYPEYPGSRPVPTSREAARATVPRLGKLRTAVLDYFREIHPGAASPDEVASALGMSLLSIRPRCSELRKLGLVEMTQQRSRNASGLQAHRLRASPWDAL